MLSSRMEMMRREARAAPSLQEREASGAGSSPEHCATASLTKVLQLAGLWLGVLGRESAALPGLVPAGEPGSGSAGLERSFSNGELLGAGRVGDWSEVLGLVQPRSVAQGHT